MRRARSLVGPRPEMESFARNFRYTVPHYEERHLVEPGLTGWAQTRCKRNLQPADVASVVPYDLFYLEHASPVLDAIVAVKTAAELPFHRAV
jgi:lipopolysaccharide/colanic/teichoic acid biosynthesis glycosyltransferase